LGEAAGSSPAGQPHLATWRGDARVARAVQDLIALSQNYARDTGVTWGQGDSSYDGATSLTDLLRLAQNYNKTLAAGTAGPTAGLAAGTAGPTAGLAAGTAGPTAGLAGGGIGAFASPIADAESEISDLGFQI